MPSMAPDDAVRWNLKISKEADRAVRSLLAERGLKKGDLSKFVDEAVRWRVFRMTVERAQRGFADLDGEELDAMIDATVDSIREEKRAGHAARR